MMSQIHFIKAFKFSFLINRYSFDRTLTFSYNSMLQSHVVELGDCHIMENETVLLRWKFDITPADVDIIFSILKGRHEGKRQIRSADAVMKDRHVTSGGGGEVQGAFAVQNACTLVWSNEHSWVRPRIIKYTVEAFAVM